MIDHTAVNVTDFQAAKAFYTKALEPLGYSLAFEMGEFMGFADEHGMDLGVVARESVGAAHVAFRCADHATVDPFSEAATAAGAQDNGSPGLRTHYHEHDHAAFVHDADGNNIEAVCQQPQ